MKVENSIIPNSEVLFSYLFQNKFSCLYSVIQQRYQLREECKPFTLANEHLFSTYKYVKQSRLIPGSVLWCMWSAVLSLSAHSFSSYLQFSAKFQLITSLWFHLSSYPVKHGLSLNVQTDVKRKIKAWTEVAEITGASAECMQLKLAYFANPI